MAQQTFEYIVQSDLLKALQTDFLDERGIRDWPDELTPKLDPDGIMVLNFGFLHNDGPDLRIVAFAKVRDSKDPVDVVFTLPGRFTNIIKMGTADQSATNDISGVDGSSRFAGR